MRRALVLLSLAWLVGGVACRKEEAPASPAASNTFGTPARPANEAQTARKQVRIFVVGDGFLPESRQFFEDQMVQKVRNAFADLPGSASADLEIRTKFSPSMVVGQSTFGLTYADENACYFEYSKEILENIARQAPEGFQPHVIVLILGGLGGGGCADGNAMLIRQDTTVEKVGHELGHAVGGLFDEYGGKSTPPNACVRWRNCSTDQAHPPWTPAGTPLRGCLQYDVGIYRAEAHCKMNDPDHPSFCRACTAVLRKVLEGDGVIAEPVPTGRGCDRDVPASPWSEALNAREGLDVLAVIDNDHYLKVVSAVPAQVSNLRPQVINGDWFALAYNRREIVSVAPLNIDDVGTEQLMARKYPPKLHQHETRVPSPAHLVRFTLLGITKENVDGADLKLDVRRIEDARRYLVVDDETIAVLGKGIAPPRYPLQESLVAAIH
jgi:hypothetical protein